MTADAEPGGKVVRFPQQRGTHAPAQQEHNEIEHAEPQPPVPAEEEGEVLDGELVDDYQPVDPAEGGKAPRWRQGQIERRPIVPVALHRDQRRDAAAFYAGLWGHRVAYHGIRLPEYAGLTLWYTPRGAWRVAGRVTSWVTVDEVRPLKAAAVRKEDLAAYLQVDKSATPKAHARRIVLGGMATATVTGVAALWLFVPALAAVSLVLTVLALGYAGRPIDRPMISPAVVLPQQQKLTSEIVIKALVATEIPALTRKDAKVTFPAPITRDGPGWRADIDLPFGITATEVMEKRAKLASGLRRPLGCVWPESVHEVHEGRLVLWVGDEDMRKAKQPLWPLRRSGAVDLFRPQPFGTDQRGRWRFLTLMFTSMVIGAVPRVGKTFALRVLLLIAALDPRTLIYAYDNKGTGDLSPLEAVAYRYGVGEEDDDIEQEIADLRELREELRRRAKVIRELPKDLCPENKITPQLADQRSYGLYPIVIGVDECQCWFDHPEYGKEFEAICTDLVKRGPALGIILILATQRPDAKSLPTGISANAQTRYCLKVMGQVENDMVLGTSSYKNGIRATMFSRDDKGIGYLAGEGDDAIIVRTPNIDQPAAEAIALRARAMREAAGTLSGYCIGEQDPDRSQTHDLLDDLQFVYARAERRDQAGVWSQTLCEGLEKLRPQVYGGWDADTLAAALKPYALRTTQLNMLDDDSGERHNWRGIKREELDQALAVRAERRGPRAVTGGVDD